VDGSAAEPVYNGITKGLIIFQLWTCYLLTLLLNMKYNTVHTTHKL